MEITESMVAVGSPYGDPGRRAAPQHSASLISIDDFGTGFSSLEYLKRAAGRRAQDRPLVRDRHADDARDAAIVRSAIELGHASGLRVVAEGVEDTQTRAQLTLMSCDLLQGYHFSPAVSADGIRRLRASGGEVEMLPERRSA